MCRESGASLVELMTGGAIVGILLAIGMPNFQEWIQNTQIRTASESTLSGLQLARNEAIKRNALVRYQLVDTLDNVCTLSNAGPHAIVSLADPSNLCDQPMDATVAPGILGVRRADESRNVVVAATGATPTVVFNGLGRTTTGSDMTMIRLTNPVGGNCQDDLLTPGPMRCLQVTIDVGGQVRLCDPMVGAGDPRTC